MQQTCVGVWRFRAYGTQPRWRHAPRGAAWPRGERGIVSDYRVTPTAARTAAKDGTQAHPLAHPPRWLTLAHPPPLRALCAGGDGVRRRVAPQRIAEIGLLDGPTRDADAEAPRVSPRGAARRRRRRRCILGEPGRGLPRHDFREVEGRARCRFLNARGLWPTSPVLAVRRGLHLV